ncbi:glycosyltransferase family 32 protein [Sellimonas catena]|uniref:Glycosyl transferase n=1 Tax=Sellimonas catena TaxID=2994035 RepID=A0A9W6CG16_9FIRM|nr:glycosyltransferase [Sellimonas catena]GLG91695.1 glycosyl transferase [Sellimonas catena]
MIPKIIHYCWFGKGKMPELANKCIESWKKKCPDYEIIEWNEENFDINCCPYVKEAYESKKFAFVTDYVRLYAMYTQGGIYMDTDVEVKKNLDIFLENEAFSGFESKTKIQTGIMAAQKELPLFKELLDYYKDRHFIDENGQQDTTTNVVTITKILSSKGFIPNGKYQVVAGVTLYPQDYFCPLDDATGIMHDSDNTAAIHWFNKSWVPKKYKLRSKITRIFHRYFGIDCFSFLKKGEN